MGQSTLNVKTLLGVSVGLGAATTSAASSDCAVESRTNTGKTEGVTVGAVGVTAATTAGIVAEYIAAIRRKLDSRAMMLFDRRQQLTS